MNRRQISMSLLLSLLQTTFVFHSFYSNLDKGLPSVKEINNLIEDMHFWNFPIYLSKSPFLGLIDILFMLYVSYFSQRTIKSGE